MKIVAMTRARYQARTLDAVLSLAEGLTPVLPCEPHGKRPLTVRGFEDATTTRVSSRTGRSGGPGLRGTPLARFVFTHGERGRLDQVGDTSITLLAYRQHAQKWSHHLWRSTLSGDLILNPP